MWGPHWGGQTTSVHILQMEQSRKTMRKKSIFSRFCRDRVEIDYSKTIILLQSEACRYFRTFIREYFWHQPVSSTWIENFKGKWTYWVSVPSSQLTVDTHADHPSRTCDRQLAKRWRHMPYSICHMIWQDMLQVGLLCSSNTILGRLRIMRYLRNTSFDYHKYCVLISHFLMS